jgi:NhaP-type Na+/H+ or K+/H+ antiporter
MGLATACQVVAPRLRIPSLILLLPAGFLLGVLAPQFRFDTILGNAFPVAVDLVVAVILFHGGLALTRNSLESSDRTVVRRLVWVGAPMTWIAGSIAAHFLIGLPWPLAFLLGAILVVSGPTVVSPILDFARPKGRVRGILQWEGTLLDPIGALLAVVVFQFVKASGATTLAEAAGLFFGGIFVGIAAAALGVLLFVIGGRLVHGNSLLGTQVLLGSVIVTAGLANYIANESGLIAALLMGLAAPRIAQRFGASLTAADPFFNAVVSIGIGVLFVAIAALVPGQALVSIALPTLAMAVILILIVRPVVALVTTSRAGLTKQERTFIACMDPRGIVAAATASSVGASLVALKLPGAEKILPATFIIIAVTVTVYGLSAIPATRLLGLRQDDDASAS